jgi:hypothetical protein
MTQKRSAMRTNRRPAERHTAVQRATRAYRAFLAAQGLRPLQIWVPDTTAPRFVAECRRQSRLAAKDRTHERVVMDWIDAVQDESAWKP